MLETFYFLTNAGSIDSHQHGLSISKLVGAMHHLHLIQNLFHPYSERNLVTLQSSDNNGWTLEKFVVNRIKYSFGD